ncbi:MAG: ribose 5-phosphate isomerase B [Acidobacteriota bacterium]
MKIAVGADHAGVELKDELAQMLRSSGHEVVDHGSHSVTESVDYPDFAAAVGRDIAANNPKGGGSELGLLVCGSGLGVAIAANKVPGVRAATCNDLFTARMARAHNDANVVALGSRVVGPGVAQEIVRLFVETPFEGGRHGRRVDKIGRLEVDRKAEK